MLHSSPNSPFAPTALSYALDHEVAPYLFFSNSFAWHQGLILFRLPIYLGHKIFSSLVHLFNLSFLSQEALVPLDIITIH